MRRLQIPYPGGKARLAKQIISFLPRRGRVFAFTGRGNLFWAAVEAGLQYEEWWLNDIATAPFFEAIKTHGHKVKVPPRSREEFEKQREAFKSGDPVATLLAPHLAYSGGLYESGVKGGSGCGDDDGGVTSTGYQQTIRECHRILHSTKAKITALDWTQLGLDTLTPDDVLICDPPYAFPLGRVKAYSDATVDYEQLVDVLLRARFKWVLCGYPHPLLHRLGAPLWAKNMQLLCVRIKAGQEERNECVWTNFTPEIEKSQKVLPPTVKEQIKAISNAASLSFKSLDEKIDDGLDVIAKDFSSLLPYLMEMHRRVSAPGRRTDLRKGAPAGLTWTAWVESKRHRLGRSLRTIQYLLQGKTDASQQRQTLIQARAHLRQEPDWSIPHTPMEVASEMARLVLEMRNKSQNARLKHRLELLAEHFLRITGQERGSDSIAPIEQTSRERTYTTLSM